MTNVLIVYCSTFGGTQVMAESSAEGAASVEGSSVRLLAADDAVLEDLSSCDALIVGSPVRHRSADARIKAFIERTLEVSWLTDDLVGRVGGVFSVGGGYGNVGAGVEVAQIGLLAAMAASGLVMVPMPKTTPGFEIAGSHWGPHGRTGGPQMQPRAVAEEARLAAFHHGANVTRVAKAVRGRELFAKGNVAPASDLVRLFRGGAGGASA